MSHLEQSLTRGESPVYRTRVHWIVFFAPAIYTLLGFMALAHRSVSIGWVFVMLGFFGVFVAAIIYATSEFGVTNKRVLIKAGFRAKRALEMATLELEDVGVYQGIWAKLFGYGTIVICGLGGTKEKLRNIKSPFEFHTHLQQQITATHGGLS
jgi:uncharacterized membrane protein YdbT with pleckstrin-like domain